MLIKCLGDMYSIMIYHRAVVAVSCLAVIIVRHEGVFAAAADVLPDNANVLTCPKFNHFPVKSAQPQLL
jgi:hypothetical protein